MLGGTKVGGGAWGLAWVDTVMEMPSPREEEAVRDGALMTVRMAEEAERLGGDSEGTAIVVE